MIPNRRRRSARWFEDGSEFRKNIALHAGVPLHFEPFPWSGRNSSRARSLASRALSTHLAQARSKWPEARHIVFAHSHGGTVAVRALTGMDEDPDVAAPEVGALVCLGTPFTYLERSSDHDGIFAFCVGAILTAAIAVVAASMEPRLLDLHPLLIMFGWGLGLASLATLFRNILKSLDAQGAEVARRPIPRLLLMRATRDEAALVIGLAQAVHSLASLLLLRIRQNESAVLTAALRYLLVSVILLFIGDAIVRGLGSPIDLPPERDQRQAFVFGTALAVLGGAYIACYALVAASVGFWNIGRWPTRMIEVDLAPPGMPAVYKCYTEFQRSQADFLRHGIYEVDAVQRDLGAIARAAHDGKLEEFDLSTQIEPLERRP